MDRSYKENPHYFGALSRDDAQSLLDKSEVGSFLIRDSSKENCLVISLKQADRIVHLLILRKGDLYTLDPEAWKGHAIANETFQNMNALILRLKQYKAMLKHGLTPNLSLQRRTSSLNAETMGAQGREELKRVLDHSENLEHEYKGMLMVMIGDKHLGADELAALAQWRERNHFTMEQHEKIVKLLGLTPQEFDKLKDFTETVDEKNLCVICCDAPKSTVFVDCGHLATCLACAQKQELKSCPVCRTPKTKIIRVFT